MATISLANYTGAELSRLANHLKEVVSNYGTLERKGVLGVHR